MLYGYLTFIKIKMQIEMMFVSIVMAMVLLSIPISPSLAQLPGAGVCWNDVTDCVAKNLNSTAPEMDPNSASFSPTKYLCCPLIQQIYDTDLSCFCSASTYLHSTDGATVASSFSSICNVYESLDALDATCGEGAPTESPTSPGLTPDTPDTTETPEVPDSPASITAPSSGDDLPADNSEEDEYIGTCWDKIGSCIDKNSNESSTNPEFDENSPSFDLSKYLCCPLIQQAADTDKPCFCNVTTVLHQTSDPETGDAFTKILVQCNVIESLASFDKTCSDNIGSGSPPKKNGGRLTAAANRMVLPESLSRYSAVFIGLAYFFY